MARGWPGCLHTTLTLTPLLAILLAFAAAPTGAKESAAVFSGHETVPFEIQDSSGTVKVDPEKPSNATRAWFLKDKVHHENYITLDLDKMQILSGESASNIKYKQDALDMFMKHAPANWVDAGWDEVRN